MNKSSHLTQFGSTGVYFTCLDFDDAQIRTPYTQVRLVSPFCRLTQGFVSMLALLNFSSFGKGLRSARISISTFGAP